MHDRSSALHLHFRSFYLPYQAASRTKRCCYRDCTWQVCAIQGGGDRDGGREVEQPRRNHTRGGGHGDQVAGLVMVLVGVAAARDMRLVLDRPKVIGSRRSGDNN
jgi:hypothetical protein